MKLRILISGILLTCTMMLSITGCAGCSSNHPAEEVLATPDNADVSSKSSEISSSISEISESPSLMTRYELEALRKTISVIEDDYVLKGVKSSSLLDGATEMNRLNAWLAVNECENIEDVKDAVIKADKIVVNIDLADPIVKIEDMENTKSNLDALKTSIDLAINSLGLTHAEPYVDRVEVSKTELNGTVGDILTVSTAIYPTFITDTELEWYSSDEALATVDAGGNILLKSAGEVIIGVTEVGSGKEAEVVITIANKPAPVKPTPVKPAPVVSKPSVESKPAPKPSGGGTIWEEAKKNRTQAGDPENEGREYFGPEDIRRPEGY
ncbi:Ig-like domain-containing protein [Oscillospiraceae bacterium PP1C4]